MENLIRSNQSAPPTPLPADAQKAKLDALAEKARARIQESRSRADAARKVDAEAAAKYEAEVAFKLQINQATAPQSSSKKSLSRSTSSSNRKKHHHHHKEEKKDSKDKSSGSSKKEKPSKHDHDTDKATSSAAPAQKAAPVPFAEVVQLVAELEKEKAVLAERNNSLVERVSVLSKRKRELEEDVESAKSLHDTQRRKLEEMRAELASNVPPPPSFCPEF